MTGKMLRKKGMTESGIGCSGFLDAVTYGSARNDKKGKG